MQLQEILAERRAERPALLTTGMVMSGISGGLSLVLIAFAPFDIGTYVIGDETVSGPEFLRRGGLMWIAVSGLMLAISYMLYRHDPDSRPLMIAFWVMFGVISLTQPFLLPGEASVDVTWVIALTIAIWYLYFKPNVVAYYRALRDAEAARAAARERTPADR
jgi:hypothetical protein